MKELKKKLNSDIEQFNLCYLAWKDANIDESELARRMSKASGDMFLTCLKIQNKEIEKIGT